MGVLIMASGAAWTSAPDYRFRAEPMPEYEELFRRADGWVGADGNFSILLDRDRVLWLFSDTFVGKVADGRRTDCVMINNSIGIQRLGPKPSVEFFYGKNADGSPRSFIVPDRGKGYFWLFHGALTSKGLYLFLMRIETFDSTSTFGFRGTGVTLGHVANPHDSPEKWKITQTDLDFCRYTDEGSTFYGSSVLRSGGWLYIYGLDSMTRGEKKRKGAMVVARVKEDDLGDPGKWRFLSGGEWRDSSAVPDALCEGLASEYSVTYLPGIRRFAAVYTLGGMFGRIMVRTAPKPEGPWGEPVEVYTCPDAKWHEKTFSYAAKAHPELANSPNELIVTYATNSTRFADLMEDARLYWPRFVRVTAER